MRALGYLITLLTMFGAGYGVAVAADMPVKYVSPAAPVISSWAGPYLGIGVGYAFDAPIEATGITKLNSRGITVEGYAGHNWQIRSIVFGLEANIDWDGHSSSTALAPATIEAITAATASAKVDYFGSVRARVGLLTGDSLLWYLAGGLGFVHTTANVAVLTATGTAANVSFSPVAGGGIEYKLMDNIFVRIDYSHYFLSKSTLAFGGTIQANVPSQLSLDKATLGVAYRF